MSCRREHGQWTWVIRPSIPSADGKSRAGGLKLKLLGDMLWLGNKAGGALIEPGDVLAVEKAMKQALAIREEEASAH